MRRALALLVAVMMFSLPVHAPASAAKDDYHGSTKLTTVTQNDLIGVSWHPFDNEALFVGKGGTLIKFDGDDNTLTALTSGTTLQLKAVAWHPSGQYAIIVGASGTVLKYTPSGTQALNVTVPGFSNWCHDVVWSYDGKYAAIAAGSRGILWYNHANGTFDITEKPSGVAASVEFFGIDWKPKGDHAIAVGSKSNIFKITRNGISTVHHELGTDYSFYAVSWRPDGSSATITGPQGTIIEYDGTTATVSARGGAGFFNTFLDVDWRPDGDYALICGENGVLLAYRDRDDYPYIPSTSTSVPLQDLEWSPDSKRALVVGHNGMAFAYPGKKSEDDNGVTFNPAFCWVTAIVAAAFIGLGFAMYVLKIKEREQRKKRYKDRKAKKRKAQRRRAS